VKTHLLLDLIRCNSSAHALAFICREGQQGPDGHPQQANVGHVYLCKSKLEVRPPPPPKKETNNNNKQPH